MTLKRQPSPAAVRKANAASPAMLAARFDGWANILTGLGVIGRDKRMSASVCHVPMTQLECEELYAADDVAANIVDCLPDDAMREWLTFQMEDVGAVAGLEKAFTALDARRKLNLAWKKARYYGGAAALMVTDDPDDLSMPLRPEAVRAVLGLTVLSRYELFPYEIDQNLLSTRYGEPIMYSFTPRSGDTQGFVGQLVHWTRLLRFDGVELPTHLRIANNYWGDSVLNRARNAIRNYNISHDAVASVLQEFNQGVFKIKGLAELLLSGNDKAVMDRLTMVNLARSICRAAIIDMDEEYTTQAAAVTGVADLLGKVEDRLVAATHIPHTKLLGEAPGGGLNANGDSEQGDWYDFVAKRQESELRPPVQRLAEVVFASRKGPTSGRVPATWGFAFNPLWQQDEGEQADTRLKIAQADQIYANMGAVDPDEVAVSRWGSGKFSAETQIDVDGRQRRLAAGAAPDEKPGEDDDPGVKQNGKQGGAA